MNMATYSVVGKRVQNTSIINHVTGATQYIDSISFPGMLWIKAVRSPVPRGKIKKIDYSKAEKLPGVAKIITAKHVPNNYHVNLAGLGVGPPDEPVLPEDEVNYKGEAICLVVARDEETAAKAANLVEVDIEELPPVLDMEEALKPGAPAIKKWGSNVFMFGGGTDGATPPGSPKRPYFLVKRGNVEQAFANAYEVVEGSYMIPPIEHAPLEPHICVVKPEPSGKLTIYTPTQSPYFVRDNVATILNIPASNIRVVSPHVGGGFGGKVDPEFEMQVAVAAMVVGRPVKWRWTREEEFTVSTTRPAVKIELKDALSREGRILGRKARLLHDAGAYARTSPYGVIKSTVNLSGPYNIENLRYEGYCVFTNRQPSSAMRGYGVFEVSYAVELHMERAARKLGIDSWEFRFINAYRNNQVTATGRPVDDAYLIEVMKEAAALAGVKLPPHLLQLSS
ncbi:molybdenum hydroxylase family protein, large subunit [Candidatus Caldarchaeum subterraneum]|uniref:Molybdenum hydroxylase family protein, large subunit n=1 Tax=Caldiarchaeum subterraneum TaxID=311458 RepID=E6N5S6_CALS0|nr:molybdenum hydroxylase family protein, large subunit [Candidatus Caldarchaeum subterraneum]BAJ47685.1 molybdenum hydroxylase family protein, large subunit [Candidatus Caldarchaeum subterraneum]BAJ50501.1 molybdenum hydroxylase family protein, large subunit [Candidatus Caldarchaeum subterraneum]